MHSKPHQTYGNLEVFQLAGAAGCWGGERELSVIMQPKKRTMIPPTP